MARRSFVRTHVSAKRSTVWVGISSGGDKVSIDTNTAVLLGSLNAVALALRPFTVVRTRGVIHWGTDQNIATEEPQVQIGAIVVSDTAAALGITALPDPTTSPDGNWFLFESLIAQFQFISGAGFNNPAGAMLQFDSKAMRKVGNDEDVTLVGSNPSSADGGRVIVIGRMLVKLH